MDFVAKKKPRAAIRVLIVLCCIIAFAISTAAVRAALVTPNYTWYSADPTANEFTISSTAGFAGFAKLVNGTAVISGSSVPAQTFAGKTVKLDPLATFNFMNNEIEPIGGAGSTSFDGIFDGQGNTLDNFRIDSQGRYSYIGIFGKTGENSEINNLIVGSSASLILTSSADQISYVGMIVGETRGSLSNCENNGSLNLTNTMNQTASVVFPIMNIGGIAGMCLDDVTGCTNNGTLTILENGLPRQNVQEANWEEQNALIINVGGIVGCAGSIDGSVNKPPEGQAPENTHGSISDCLNTGDFVINTPNQNGYDRFGNPAYVTSTNIGGIAGYSRGSIKDCTNTAYLKAEYATSFGGIVGSVRAKTTGGGYSGNFTSEDTDDGMASKELLIVRNCINEGIVYGHAHVGGIVGRSGTYVDVDTCLNAENAFVVGTRVTKPFPSGIIGGTYGTVSYCANLGTVASGKWTNESLRTITAGGGYYAAGIVGNTAYFSKKDASDLLLRTSPMPEVYGCYNAGKIIATAGMRQRNIVGDNAGYVHDNIGVKGLCSGDKLVYGDDPENDTESSGGLISNNNLITANELADNESFETVEGYTTTPLALLNKSGDKDGWVSFWVKSDGTVNAGYPVLNGQVTWPPTDITNATVGWAANAEYTGIEAIPKASVTTGTGIGLIQGIDFKVIPEPNAVNVTTGGLKPYTATVVGIGNYTGTATQGFGYDIDKGDLANCTAIVDSIYFNWKDQPPTAEMVHVTNLAGTEIDSSEYHAAIDPEDKNLTNGEAINAKEYKVIITADENSIHFVGKTSAQYRIKQARIINDSDPIQKRENAYVETIKYQGQEHDWQSLTVNPNVTDAELEVELEYTGYPIRPDVISVLYLDRPLVEGTDYRVIYGNAMPDGTTVPAGEENLGLVGSTAYGYITVRYIAGSNFSNYDNMKFLITDTAAKNDLAGAVLRDSRGRIIDTDYEVIFEEGSVYEPVEVWFGGSKLTEETDYTISYSDNTALGTASFSIIGTGDNFEGTNSGTFDIISGLPYEFTFDEYNEIEKTVTVTGVNYLGSNVTFDMVIPGEVEKNSITYTVTKIGEKAFGGNLPSDIVGSETNLSKRKIRSVVIPPGVRTIETYAFGTGGNTEWNNIRSVTFDNEKNSQLTTIGVRAFQGCGNLTEFTFPAKVAEIGTGAFNVGTSSNLKTLSFLTKDPTLPSSISTSLTFSGVGASGEVRVNGYPGATRVKQLVANNAGTTAGSNAGRNFKFYEYETPVLTYDISWYNTTDMSFEISTAAELEGLALIVNNKPVMSAIGAVPGIDDEIPADDFAGKIIKLTADIDLGASISADGWKATGKEWTPIGSFTSAENGTGSNNGESGRPFKGTFDGQYHRISNLYVPGNIEAGFNDDIDNSHALFGDLGRDGLVKNLILASGYVRGDRFAGGIVGRNWGHIENTINYANVETDGGRSGGGIAGVTYVNGDGWTGYIKNSINYGDIHAGDQAYPGGIVGDNEGLVENCLNLGTGYHKTQPGYKFGIVGGGRTKGTIINSYSIDGANNNGLYGNDAGTSESLAALRTLEEIKEPAFAAILGAEFVADYENNNNGIPTLLGYAVAHDWLIDAVGLPGSGDFNGDGKVTASEAVMISKLVATGATGSLRPIQIDALDMDRDGLLTMVDVILILRTSAGMGSPSRLSTLSTTADISEAKVVFDSQGGSDIEDAYIEIGEKVSEPESPIREGYIFLGWYTSDDGGLTLPDESFDFAETAITEDITLYAKWVKLIVDDPGETDTLDDPEWIEEAA